MYLTTEEKPKPMVRKQFILLCEVVASKVWCHIGITITCKNRDRVICGLAHEGESDAQPGGEFAAFPLPEFSRHCITILTFVETFKEQR